MRSIKEGSLTVLFTLLWKKGNVWIKDAQLWEKGQRACMEMWKSLLLCQVPHQLCPSKRHSIKKWQSQFCVSGTLPNLCKPPPLLQPCRLLPQVSSLLRTVWSVQTCPQFRAPFLGHLQGCSEAIIHQRLDRLVRLIAQMQGLWGSMMRELTTSMKPYSWSSRTEVCYWGLITCQRSSPSK